MDSKKDFVTKIKINYLVRQGFAIRKLVGEEESYTLTREGIAYLNNGIERNEKPSN